MKLNVQIDNFMTFFCTFFYLIGPIVLGLIGIGMIALVRFLVKKQFYPILFILCVIFSVAALATNWNNLAIPESINSCL